MRSQRLVASLDLFDPKNKLKVNIGSLLIALFVVMGFSVVLSHLGQSTYWLLLPGILLIPTTFLHEILHYLFQWLFSRSKPHIGFKFPFPYSALAPNTYITRNQGVFCALAPFLFITPILVLSSLFMNPLLKTLFWVWALLEGATCFGDFFAVLWLLRHPKHLKLANVNLSNALFEVTESRKDDHREEKSL